MGDKTKSILLWFDTIVSYGFFLNLSNGNAGVEKNIQTKIVTIKIKRKQKKKIVTIGKIPYALSQARRVCNHIG